MRNVKSSRQLRIGRKCPHGVYWPSTHSIAYSCQLCNPVKALDINSTCRYVYFLTAAEGIRRVKIGIAADILARMKCLQTGSPAKLELFGYIACHEEMARKVETALHRRLAPYHSHGEWYALTDKSHKMLSDIVLGFRFEDNPRPFEEVLARRGLVEQALDLALGIHVGAYEKLSFRQNSRYSRNAGT